MPAEQKGQQKQVGEGWRCLGPPPPMGVSKTEEPSQGPFPELELELRIGSLRSGVRAGWSENDKKSPPLPPRAC